MSLMILKEIKDYIEQGYEVTAYGRENHIVEISFFKKVQENPVLGSGFSFMSCELRQRALRNLFRKINKIKLVELKTF